jgi:hypothetical protein
MGRIQVRVQPRARENEISGERDGALVVRVTAPPAEGKANDAARKLLAKRLGVLPAVSLWCAAPPRGTSSSKSKAWRRRRCGAGWG